jgi:outer membrane receptor protein involved in Fe transport
VVSLDMFPAGLLDNVTVVKSYSPDRPAEFAGGLVEIVPAKLPSRPHFDLSYNVGFNTQTFGENVLDHAGGDRDWLGLSNGDRVLPGSFPDRRLIRGGIFTPDVGFNRDELAAFGKALENSWTPQVDDGKADQGFGVAFARRFGRVGLLASVSQSYRHRYQEEVQNYYRTDEGGLTPFSEYDYRVGSNRGVLAGLLGFSAQFTPEQRLGVQAFATARGERETRTFEGFNADVGENLRNSRQLWREENLRSVQVTGDHLFQGLSNSTIEWRATLAGSSRDEPDIREMLYEEIGGTFQFVDESQSAFHMFTDLNEDTWDLSASWSTFFTAWNGLPTMVKVGPSYSRRQRDFSSRRFRFVPVDTRGIDLSVQPEELFTPDTIGGVFELREDTRATDFYDAEQTNTAFFGMVDLPLANAWRLVGGARVERFDQRVDTFDLFDVDVSGEAEAIRAEIKNTDVFPAVNLVYAVRPDHNIRFGFSQTVNRPEFRELAPFEFTDIVGGRAVVGNPELNRALIRNYDVRWEWFPGADQLVAASFFYKDFDSPIERFVEPTAQLRTSFTNADSARNVGLELEARRRLGNHLLVGANYTFVDSEITLTEFQTNVLTSLSRPLYGTSRNVFNGMAEVRGGRTSARVLVNYFGDRIADVGSLGLPDIIEQGRPTIDLIATHRLGHFNIRLAVENLNDANVEFMQADQVQRLYKTGRLVMLQLGYSAF